MKWKSTSKIIHEEPGIRLEIVNVIIGDCEAVIYRELFWDQQSISLNEYKEQPLWWDRQIKVDKILSYSQRYYINNKEKLKQYQKEWFRNNREKWNEYQKRRG